MWFMHLPLLLFVFAFGAAVGSFINVVIYRLPMGMSVTMPPSRCPTCGARLTFFWENLPILGWFLVRGRCRYCGAAISVQYVLVELLMALLFVGLYLLVYIVHPQFGSPDLLAIQWWSAPWSVGFFRTWPIFIAFAFLLAALFAMTVIDARTFTIPIEIPLFITFAGFIAYAIQGFLPLHPQTALRNAWPVPATDWQWFAVTVGAMVGLLIGMILLRTGTLRYSFADYHEYVEADQVLGDYPHARREMLLEIAFLLPMIVGAVAGWFLGVYLPTDGPPVFVQAVGGSFMGYLAGGGLVWAIRILGTLGFGREAMGMGDVHLLAAVGAVVGGIDVIFIFFLAPFFGLLWAIASMGAASLLKTSRRELPYGPHLALAAALVIAFRPFFEQVREAYLPFLPAPGLW